MSLFEDGLAMSFLDDNDFGGDACYYLVNDFFSFDNYDDDDDYYYDDYDDDYDYNDDYYDDYDDDYDDDVNNTYDNESAPTMSKDEPQAFGNSSKPESQSLLEKFMNEEPTYDYDYGTDIDPYEEWQKEEEYLKRLKGARELAKKDGVKINF